MFLSSGPISSLPISAAPLVGVSTPTTTVTPDPVTIGQKATFGVSPTAAALGGGQLQ